MTAFTAPATDPLTPTVYFSACRGVFEGGGIKCAAYAGAFGAASSRGVGFVELAGTSAGSIVAALIGAGADPDFLTRHCSNLVPSDLLRPPQGVLRKGSRLLSFCAGAASMTTYGRFIRMAAFGGQYSSAGIEEWIEDRLRDLLPSIDAPIRFRDLRIPTSIVATDLSAGKPFIWSTTKTPDARVAFAVRCSCSIPLFFEPVSEGNNLYVDGGLLSNLPAFVFANQDGAHAERTLAFSLVNDVHTNQYVTVRAYLRRLVETAVAGSTDIQMSLQPTISRIRIPTKGTRATDFDLGERAIKELVDAGATATFKFFQNEDMHLRDHIRNEIDIANEDDLFGAIARAARTVGRRLVVAHRDTVWFWKLFPVFARWRAQGADVHVVVPPVTGSALSIAKESQRRRVLDALGATVVETKSFRHSAFVLDGDDASAAFVLNEDTSDLSPVATAYVGTSHRLAVRSILAGIVPDTPVDRSPSIELKAIGAGRITNALREGVLQYRGENVDISIEEVTPSSVALIVHRVRPYKFTQMRYMAEIFTAKEIPMFAPAACQCPGCDDSIVTPPVVEIRGEQRVVIEGNTRFLFAYRKGLPKINAVVVRGVEEPLPGTPVQIANVTLARPGSPTEERIQNFDYASFRAIERAIRPLGLSGEGA